MNKKKIQIDSPHAPDADVTDSERSKSQDADLETVVTAIINQEELNNELQKELKRFLIPKLRSASYRWKFRSQAIKDARVSRGLYKCAICGNSELKNGDFKVDHIDPVVPLSGWDGLNWTVYIQRMFCDSKGFQILCTLCHDIKTDFEVQMRKLNREKKKKLDNE